MHLYLSKMSSSVLANTFIVVASFIFYLYLFNFFFQFLNFKLRKKYIFFSQVKLVKCLVQNIVIDISFNQLGGLCTLCFLEQVNSILSFLVYFDTLFKASNFYGAFNMDVNLHHVSFCSCDDVD